MREFSSTDNGNEIQLQIKLEQAKIERTHFVVQQDVEAKPQWIKTILMWNNTDILTSQFVKMKEKIISYFTSFYYKYNDSKLCVIQIHNYLRYVLQIVFFHFHK